MSSTVDYGESIPNNVELASDRRLQRALAAWQPRFRHWWAELGPDLPHRDVYLRTAVAVGQGGWAQYGHVPLAEYRWGIFLAPREPERCIGFGEHLGQPVWQQVPGEYRSELQRLIVVQGDTEPASVEQQRQLGRSAPSLYDLRSLLQINVEEARHLWAMVYLLHAYFGREGREEADALLARSSGDRDAPRLLGAFNEPTPDWLALFMFTYFTDRDGKFQLGTLRESGFDPLARSCEFMLKEEAHHLFVGTTGIDRVLRRSAELMREHDSDDIAPHGGIPLAVVQRYLNQHYAVSLDLFGAETSSNAAAYFSAGLKGRWRESRREDDHRLLGALRRVDALQNGALAPRELPALATLNEDLRGEYVRECEGGVARWNRVLAQAGVDARLRLPHRGFARRVGVFGGLALTPAGEPIDAAQWERRREEWLPGAADRALVAALMHPVCEPGKIAGWIAPPLHAVHGQPLEYAYVRFAGDR